MGYGPAYKPTNPLIEMPNLQALLGQANAALDDVQAKLAPWKNKVADRENVYEGIRPLTTQVLAAFDERSFSNRSAIARFLRTNYQVRTKAKSIFNELEQNQWVVLNGTRLSTDLDRHIMSTVPKSKKDMPP